MANSSKLLWICGQVASYSKSIAMTNKEFLCADFLDILFERRNKSYGAYALRKTYTYRLASALGIALSIVLLFVIIAFIRNDKAGNGLFNDIPAIILTNVDIPKEEIKEPDIPDQKPRPQIAQSDYQPIIVVPDLEADTSIVEIETLTGTDIGNEKVDGEKPDGLVNASTQSNGSGAVVVREPDGQKGPDLPGRPPTFPGGPQAWMAFLQRYLQAPGDIEPGQRVEVLVRFWIDIDGRVSKPEIIKSGGESFDKEVIRVMKKMPRWEPAMQHGNFVAVAYTQPVIFIASEQ